MRVGISQEELLGGQSIVLAKVLEPDALDLLELEAQEVRLARSGRFVAAERLELTFSLSNGGPGRNQLGQIDARIAVQGAALAGGGEQAELGMLTMEVDERSGLLGQLGGRYEATIAIGAGATRSRHDPGENHLVLAAQEPTLHRGLGGTGTNHAGVGPVADEEPDGADHHRLPGSGLACERGHAGPEQEREPIDHAEVGDGQLSEHQAPSVTRQRKVARSGRGCMGR